MYFVLLSNNNISARESYLRYFSGYWTRPRHVRRELKSRPSLVAYTEPRIGLRKELAAASLIGETPDRKRIYLFDYRISLRVIRGLGRLRELTCRAIGECTTRIPANCHQPSYDRNQ